MDLKNPKLIWLKDVLFGVMLAMSGGLIVALTRDWLVAGLVLLVAWSAARGYYFMFYVIEKYVDSAYRFAGVWDFVMYATRRKSTK
jgi:uncharacterized membrane-anchored protein